MVLLERAKALGGGIRNSETLKKALKQFVERRSPEERERRRELRRKRKDEQGAVKAVRPETVGRKDAPGVGPTKLPRKSASPSRTVPAQTRDQVYIQAGGRCTFVGKDGKRCTETRALQVQHCKPFALGGTHDVENLTLFCPAHNLLDAERVFGRGTIDAHRNSQSNASQS
jgi:5-methylcytosine-specific restriction endonuclease McrA